MEVFLQIIVLFILMLTGYASAKLKWIDSNAFTGINRFVIYLAMPALTIAKLQVTADAALLLELLKAFMIATIAMLVCGGLSHLVFKKEESKRRGVLTNLAMLSNCGFMGYPVVEARFGPEALIYAVMFVTSFNLLAWTAGTAFYKGRRSISIKVLVTNPSLIAVIIGLVFLVFQIKLPSPITNALNMLGNTTTPISLLVIGSQLVGLSLLRLKDLNLMKAMGLRLIIFPLMLIAVLRLFSVPDPMAATLFLCYAMPSAALTGMQAEFYQSDAALASSGIALSTALCMVTIPLMLLIIA